MRAHWIRGSAQRSLISSQCARHTRCRAVVCMESPKPPRWRSATPTPASAWTPKRPRRMQALSLLPQQVAPVRLLSPTTHAARPARSTVMAGAVAYVYSGPGAGSRCVLTTAEALEGALEPAAVQVGTRVWEACEHGRLRRGPPSQRASASDPRPQVHFLNTEQLLKGDWRQDAAMLVLPGGADLPYVRDLNGAGNALIRGEEASVQSTGSSPAHQSRPKRARDDPYGRRSTCRADDDTPGALNLGCLPPPPPHTHTHTHTHTHRVCRVGRLHAGRVRGRLLHVQPGRV